MMQLAISVIYIALCFVFFKFVVDPLISKSVSYDDEPETYLGYTMVYVTVCLAIFGAVISPMIGLSVE